MVLWLICAVLTAGLVYVLARPLVMAVEDSAAAEPAIQIYRDQLAEIEADCSRGLLGPDEANAARIEISRRLLAASDAAGDTARRPRRLEPRRAFVALAIVVPAAALGLYMMLGSPGVPTAARGGQIAIDPGKASIGELVARVEQRLRERPDDGQGWDVIAPIYLRTSRYPEATQAFERAIRLLGESPGRLSGLGEASMMASGGVVTEDARKAFARLLALQPESPEPHFWLALAKEQDGLLKEAAADYRALLARKDAATAPWRSLVEERLKEAEGRIAAGLVLPAGRGPTAEAMAAAAELPPDEQARAIDEMVNGLAERLKQNGADGEGWQRLVRSYVVLGRRDEALKALANGRNALSGDGEALSNLNALAQTLGLGS